MSILKMLTCFMLLTILCASAQATPRYHATAIDRPGDGWSVAYSINNAGEVVGEAQPAFSSFRWNTAQGMNILPVSDGYFSEDSHGLAVNYSGVVAGYCGRQSGPRAIIWNDDSMVDLGLEDSYAFGINDEGEVVGRAGHYGFLWRSGFGVTTLGYATEARDINNTGMIVGSWDDNGVSRAVMWNTNVEMTNIGGLQGSYESSARAINDAGQVVGFSTFHSGTDPWLRGFVWTESGGFTEIPSLADALTVEAFDINNAGVVVGHIDYQTGPQAFIYTPESGTVVLNSLLDSASQDWFIVSANGINDSGQIVGYGVNPTLGGNIHAFLLTPVPEPSAVLALSSFIGGLATFLRKRK